MKKFNTPVVTIETITPQQAQEYLQHNTTNRAMSMPYVRGYANAMLRGEWVLNGQSIDFDTEGNLINGQHRLKACVLANKPFETVVCRGITPAAYTTYDNGRSRQAGQLLAMRGVGNANNVAVAVKQAFYLTNSRVGTNTAVSKQSDISNSMIVSLFEQDPETYIDCVRAAGRIKGFRPLTVGMTAGYMYHLRTRLSHTKDMVEVFFNDLCSYNTCNNPMIDNLRVRFLKDLTSPVKMTNEYKQNLIRKAWNAWIDGKETRRVDWNKEKEGYITLR